ncbi:hypothetical protein Ddye_007836 [Dipteronia dyeriana]|uniref:SWIM-type domain-containing protein n=1 Tax=Dipteronia dyeriana TaxID=168575 RepID=A0AAE0CSJ1_9ROSI|nr:hypothetical protein Ddye_007836 [Dipteronia dyeriana]
MVGADIGPTKAYFYLANEADGAENLGFLKKDARNYLQRKKYEMLESGDAQKLISCMGVRMNEVHIDSEVYTYEANEDGQERVYRVSFNSISCNVSCCCMLYESMGMLCRHALKVLDFNNVTSIPSRYILKRWTKEAKKGNFMSCEIKNKLVEAMELLEKDSETISMLECLKKVDEQPHKDLLGSETPILNPPIAKTK